MFDYKANHWQQIMIGGYTIGPRMYGGLGFNFLEK
jgi:hypothetical protein